MTIGQPNLLPEEDEDLVESKDLKVTVYVKNGKFTIFIFYHKNKRFLGIF